MKQLIISILIGFILGVFFEYIYLRTILKRW